MCDRDSGVHFDQFLENVSSRWGLGSDLAPRQKLLPLAPITRTFADRVLAVGDAGGLVKATTGGGIYYSLLTASLAADTLTSALAAIHCLRPRFRATSGRGGANSAEKCARSSGCDPSLTA